MAAGEFVCFSQLSSVKLLAYMSHGCELHVSQASNRFVNKYLTYGDSLVCWIAGKFKSKCKQITAPNATHLNIVTHFRSL